MKVHVVIVDDTHADTEAYVFSDPEEAIAYAKDTARQYAEFPEDIEESQVGNYLYYARYSPESKVWVYTTELDKEVKQA